jgi:hypothetical protein
MSRLSFWPELDAELFTLLLSPEGVRRRGLAVDLSVRTKFAARFTRYVGLEYQQLVNGTTNPAVGTQHMGWIFYYYYTLRRSLNAVSNLPRPLDLYHRAPHGMKRHFGGDHCCIIRMRQQRSSLYLFLIASIKLPDMPLSALDPT